VKEHEAQGVFLIRSLESHDFEGVLFSKTVQEEAFLKAGSLPLASTFKDPRWTEEEKRFLVRRGKLLRFALENEYPFLEKLDSLFRVKTVFFLLFLFGVFLLGWSFNLVGNERRISILSFPLAGMLLWNLSLYFLLLFYAFFKPSHSLSSGFSWWKEGFSKRLLRLIGKLPEGNPSVKVLRQGLQHFFREWMFWGSAFISGSSPALFP
jgi:hypothetical protein